MPGPAPVRPRLDCGMRVLVCPTAFKGTLSAQQATDAIAKGTREAWPSAEIRRLPLSDGGPGLLDALRALAGGSVERWRVRGPPGDAVEGRCLWAEDGAVAVIESADACGLALLGGARWPLEADTRGVGELISRAVAEGASRLVVGLGGSASTDGGTGLARVFGYRFLASDGTELPPGGGGLHRLARIVPGARPEASVLALADVANPLTGPDGAARTFSPQKGASPAEVDRLEAGLERLAERVAEDLGVGVAQLSGAGAAGGLGAGCVAFLGAELVSGSDWVLERTGFDRALEEADVAVTGEGAFDGTSRAGKIIGRVLERAAGAGVPVVLICGRIVAPAPEAALAVDSGWLTRVGTGSESVIGEAGEPGELDAAGLARLVRLGLGGFRDHQRRR